MIDLSSTTLLVVDDEAAWLRTIALHLAAEGFTQVFVCKDPRDAVEIALERSVDVAIIDLMMPHLSGEELMARLKEVLPELPVIISTGVNDVETAVRCVKAGAYDYYVKTSEFTRLLVSIRHATEMGSVRKEANAFLGRFLDDTLEHPEHFGGITTCEREIRALFHYIEVTAPSTEPFLITGETGAGKELFARAVHSASGRKGTMVSVNVAGLDDTVFSDTLFGHTRGAFTGAAESREGLLAQAQGGTLFLDEISNLAPSSQIKLLRLLQEREYYPLGADHPRKTDARIIAASQLSLCELQHSETFRQDLMYRLRTHHVHIPPLRSRKNDIAPLAAHFIEEATASFGQSSLHIPAELYTLLSTYAFPGNIRELRALLYDAVGRNTGGALSLASLRQIILPNTEEATNAAEVVGPDVQVKFGTQLPALKTCTELLIDEALERAQGNQGIAAGLLGISRQALNNRLRQRHKKA